MAAESVLRVTKEITNLQKGPDLSLAVTFNDENVRKVRALIIGPPETPYEFGFFEFSIYFTKKYPYEAPHVKALTNNGGSTRFNPNIYADGKICLSILGTWRGEPGEQWSNVQGLESILISIQSLMSSNPWENEPGFETINKESDKKEARLYGAKIRHETLRLSVIERLETLLNIPGPLRREKAKGDPQVKFGSTEAEEDKLVRPFTDLYKRRFLWYYQSYLNSIDEEIATHGDDVKDGKAFRNTPFECGSNSMHGHYCYSQLKERLGKIYNALLAETKEMEATGLRQIETPMALGMQNAFENISKKQNNTTDMPMSLELIDKNPFVWRVAIFGRPMSNLDGGIFNIKIVWGTNFPETQPRVQVETPLFHQRISPQGILCYFPSNSEDIGSHVKGIIYAIEEESPPYDPRTRVNPEASKLLWGSPQDKRSYNSRLRRSAQASTEE